MSSSTKFALVSLPLTWTTQALYPYSTINTSVKGVVTTRPCFLLEHFMPNLNVKYKETNECVKLG